MKIRTENWIELFESTNSSELVVCKICGAIVHQLQKFQHAQKHIIGKRKEVIVITGANVWNLPIGAKKEIEIPIYGEK